MHHSTLEGPSTCLRVLLNPALLLDAQVTAVGRETFYQLRLIYQLHPFLKNEGSGHGDQCPGDHWAHLLCNTFYVDLFKMLQLAFGPESVGEIISSLFVGPPLASN